jgi:hypothetical protein
LLASHNNPAVSDFATDTAVADVIAAAGIFPWVSVVVMVSAVAYVPAAAVVLTAVNIPGAPAGAKVSAVAPVTTAVDVLLLQLFPPTFIVSLPLLESLLLMASLLWNIPSFNVVSNVLASILLASLDIPVVSCTVVSPLLFI